MNTNMTRIITVLVITFTISNVGWGQSTYIPDDNFEQAIIDLGYDDVLDDYVLTEAIDTILSMQLDFLGIDDLTGIEDFSSLEGLDCSNNNITTLDFSANPMLLYLICSMNNLVSLDVTECTSLIRIWAGENELDEIDLTNCPLLEIVDLRDNNLTEIDLSMNVNLLQILVPNNELTNLNLTGLVNIVVLDCSENELTMLEVEHLEVLSSLSFNENLIEEIDVSANEELFMIQCRANLLEDLDVSNNINIEIVLCSNNFLDTLDLSVNIALGLFDCSFNQLKKLDLSLNSNLNMLACDNNELEYLSVKNGNNTAIGLYSFRIFDNPMLTCIEVDDEAYSTTTWTVNIDDHHVFSEECNFAEISTLQVDEEFRVYPTPTTGLLYVDIDEVKANFSIVNLSGKQVMEGTLSVGTNNIQVSDLLPGMYILIVNGSEYQFSRKIIVK